MLKIMKTDAYVGLFTNLYGKIFDTNIFREIADVTDNIPITKTSIFVISIFPILLVVSV